MPKKIKRLSNMLEKNLCFFTNFHNPIADFFFGISSLSNFSLYFTLKISPIKIPLYKTF